MKGRIYSSDTERWVSTPTPCVCVLMFYPPVQQKHLNVSTLHHFLSPLFTFSFSHSQSNTPHPLYAVAQGGNNCRLRVFICLHVHWSPTGRGGADCRGLAEYLLGPAATNQAPDAGWPRANPAAPLLYVLALGLQSGQSRVRGPDRSSYTSLSGNGDAP